ncbi:uncharacterized protein N7496_010148 [Penicillium cataractarum]|uniref:Zn(2)-C6 fungal-type domain-containing protein n=1 Tax=Penicillium cataractarum TaxID=2100454 RepID=A0A9W9V2T9_9EURO|nr:uncharacterized protein N7496_010148 [Penicillium cataractarum]KAJ5364435.1 hypothetical protein N7496_010148 [Penicillium cataractarum]
MAQRDLSRHADRLGADDIVATKSSKVAHSRPSEPQSASSTPSSRSAWSTRSPQGVEMVNSLPTPRPEESPLADSVPVDSSDANGSRGRAPNAKVAIPRDVNSLGPPSIGRVPRACSSCRSRKVKCSGEQPVCRQCRELDLACHYPLGWNERMKKEANDLSALVQDYRKFVQDLLGTAENAKAQWAHSTLQKYQSLMDDLPETIQLPTPATQDENSSGENSTDVDHNDQNNPPSENEQWLDPKFGQIEPDGKDEEQVADGVTTDTLDYALGDFATNVPQPVNKYGMPSRQLSDLLFEEYWNNVHPGFPMINRPLFRIQYQSFWDQGQQPGDKWLAILNVIFAIAAKYGHLTQAPWRGEENDHFLYFNRARLLSLTGEELFSPPNLQQVQLEGLVAFYLLATDQIGRAWRISALAARSAVTLGVNRSLTNKLPAKLREARFRLWWCLYTLEQTLGLISGHISSIPKDKHAPPLPIPFEEEEFETDSSASALLQHPGVRTQWLQTIMPSSKIWPSDGYSKNTKQESPPRDDAWLKFLEPNAGLFYLFYCDLAVIIEEIVNQIHVSSIWIDSEKRIDDLRSRIEYWKKSLPSSLDFTTVDLQSSVSQMRYKLGLAFHYQSARIVLGRLWLCRRDELGPDQPQMLNHNMAMMTLDAAKQILDLLPDQPNTVQLYQMFPWWSVLHYISHAAKIVLFELSIGCMHVRDSTPHLVWLAKKAICWLHAISTRSPGAKRAWRLCDSFYRKVSEQVGYCTNDIPPTTETVNPSELNQQYGSSSSAEVGDLEPFDFQIDDVELTDWIT